MLPETQYARLGALHIAYQVLGQGPPDILLLDQWFSHVEAQWDVRPLAEFRERLASFGRLILYDKRGSGLSDPIPTSALPTIEEWMDDIATVRRIYESDIRDLLPAIRVPTLVIHRAG
jgi:pimeloyl-ACP methyl ester carboxylesterase